MKKIINGKKYDTETAEKVGSWNNGLSSNHFNNCSETLYRKKTNEFFLYGEGGAASKYAGYNYNSSWGSDKIIPMTLNEAKTWVEEHMDGDEYESLFGEVEE